jgi:hypothetical protein
MLRINPIQRRQKLLQRFLNDSGFCGVSRLAFVAPLFDRLFDRLNENFDLEEQRELLLVGFLRGQRIKQLANTFYIFLKRHGWCSLGRF